MGSETKVLLGQIEARAYPILEHLTKISTHPARGEYTNKWWKDIHGHARDVANALIRLERRHGDGALERGLDVVRHLLAAHPDNTARERALAVVETALQEKRGEGNA